jgi:two-component system chemotaxis response regulator CheY
MAVDVLIADGSALFRIVFQRLLRQSGLDIGMVYEADDGIEALETLKNKHVGLVLSSDDMPRMNGIELLDAIKKQGPLRSIPVVIVSTEATESRIREAVTKGAAGYICRPVTAQQLSRTLESLIQEAED